MMAMMMMIMKMTMMINLTELGSQHIANIVTWEDSSLILEYLIISQG